MGINGESEARGGVGGSWGFWGGSLWPCPPQDDEVVLQCTTTLLKEQLKLCLAAEGFGNRLCFLEPTSNAQVGGGEGGTY